MATAPSPAAEVEAIKADLRALRDDVSSLSRSLLHAGADSAKAARDVVEQSVTCASRSAEDAIRERPFMSIAVALGVGAVLGAAICRR
ncbi:MAG TPA: hypothetical protein PKC43_07965 [Phycisphaerales bacterium]|nr:hypothetical protein [Phycisphaerales bacterium]HMP37373.1 hypothetical protein [Phycisphaerales bacterium]